MDKMLYHMYLMIKQHKISVVAGALLCIVALSFLASRIAFEEDITKLLPANEKTRKLQKVLQAVNFTDKIIVHIRRQQEGDIADLTQYATQFLDSLSTEAGAYVKNIQGSISDESIDTTLDFVYDNLPQFLSDNDYQKIALKLEKDSVAASTLSNYKTLLSPSGIIASKTILKDPLGLSFLGLKKLQGLGLDDNFMLKDGFVMSKDEQHVLLFITPTYPASDAANNQEFAEILYNIQLGLNEQYSAKADSQYFGGLLIAVANAQQIKHDIQMTIGIALTVLMVIFIVFYKKVIVPLILFTPTILGALLSVAVLYLIRTEISAISLGIGSVLLGVTLDYSLHILTHLRNHEGVQALYQDIAKPILMSAFTTALAFLCLLFLDSQALQDLGIFAAVSVLGASVVALLFIPQVYRAKKISETKKKTFLDRLSHYNFHSNKWLVLSVVMVFVISLFTYSKVTFNNDLATLNFEPAESIEAKKNLDALTNLESKSVYAVAYGKTLEEALQFNDEVYQTLEGLSQQNQILSFSNIGALVHSNTKQMQRIAKWNQFWSSERQREITNNLITTGSVLGFKPSAFKKFYSTLSKDFTPIALTDYEVIPAITIDDFITIKEDITTVTSLVKLEDIQAAKVQAAFEGNENMLLIDRKQMNESLLGSLKTDFNKLISYSMGVVLLLLLLYYKSLSLTIITLLPVFLTWVITVGLMGLFGLEFNIFNIIISTFIFGLGIDYAIFMTNGLLKELKTGQKVLGTHKTSIVLSVLTTLLGIGVLVFAKHPALYTISAVSIIGIFSAMLLAFVVQPLLFTLFIGSYKKRPITLRYLIHSVGSFTYFGGGGFLLSMVSPVFFKLAPVTFRKTISQLMKSVLYTNPFFTKNVLNPNQETFKKPAFLIANHTSFLDILAMGMLHPKLIFLVNDWVYNSPVFGGAVRKAGFYPVSKGLDEALIHLQPKIDQGFSLIAFPEGTRSTSNKLGRFHKGSFFLAEKLGLDIVPVLIHGFNEILPKGSFSIRDGVSSLKILDRISPDDTSFGIHYSERTKKISTFFRQEFAHFRKEMEAPNYFHKTLLLDYRYKGNALYKAVKQDLKSNAIAYHTIINTVPKDASVLHVSKGKGQLDFLLVLDSARRNITSCIDDETMCAGLNHSFISNTERKVQFLPSINDEVHNSYNTIILNGIKFSEGILEQIDIQVLNFVVLYDTPQNAEDIYNHFVGFETIYLAKPLQILKKS
jgi:1-acyl-sn-glycerol-3-phosphate acyltransferase